MTGWCLSIAAMAAFPMSCPRLIERGHLSTYYALAELRSTPRAAVDEVQASFGRVSCVHGWNDAVMANRNGTTLRRRLLWPCIVAGLIAIAGLLALGLPGALVLEAAMPVVHLLTSLELSLRIWLRNCLLRGVGWLLAGVLAGANGRSLHHPRCTPWFAVGAANRWAPIAALAQCPAVARVVLQHGCVVRQPIAFQPAHRCSSSDRLICARGLSPVQSFRMAL